MNRLARFALAMLAGALVLVVGPLAHAQDDATLHLGVLLTDEDDSGEVRDALVDALVDRDDVELVDANTILTASDNRGIERSDYLKGTRRAALTDEFAAVLEEVDSGGLFLLDMISGGDRVQLVVIGPGGDERADIRVSVGEILESEATLNARLVEPGVNALPNAAWRRDSSSAAVPSQASPDDSPEQPPPVETPDVSASASADASTTMSLTRSPRTKSALQLSAGAFFGRRSFDATSNLDYQIANVVPLVGARLSGRVRLVEWSEGASQLWIAAQGAWAPYSVEFRANGTGYQENGQHIGGRAEILYRQALTSSLSALATAGADIVSDTIDSNPVFTGSRYINGRVTVGVSIHPVDVFELALSGGVLPVISAETSGQSYGESSASLGYGAVAELNLALSDHLSLTTGYDLRAYQASFADPQVIAASIDTTELFHGASFGITYGL